MHTLVGLLELAEHDGTDPEPPLSRVEQPLLRALLVGKTLTAARQGVRLRLGEESALRQGPARPDDLLTVLGNLIDNALDAVLEHSHGEPWIEVELREEGEEHDGNGEDTVVEIRVTDNGPGVPPGSRRWIFGSGASTKRHTDSRHGGLGLALVRSVAEHRGGTATVAAREGGGAAFTVRLPSRPRGTERRAS
ncbi:sensor histidine kinase [Streptomyces sp. TRM49041]|uniref:sensor histidine kinase n=1 Tax=Streptomyces sp. TRM49041 TaxID=2603216 RepID=UPI0016568A0C|nr:ATP-binding protein [Streptomyces sp. TRM49041]